MLRLLTHVVDLASGFFAHVAISPSPASNLAPRGLVSLGHGASIDLQFAIIGGGDFVGEMAVGAVVSLAPWEMK